MTMRRAARRDTNEARIVRYLVRCGASVQQLSDPGVPDLLLGFGGITVLAEVKGDKGKLTEAQVKFFTNWKGQAAVIRSIADAKKLLRSIMPIRVFLCPNHGIFEVRQTMQDDPLRKCPKCNEFVRQIYYPSLTIYRGDGWAGKKDKHKSGD